MNVKHVVVLVGLALFQWAAVAAEGKWDEFFPGGLVNAQGEKVSPEVLKGKLVCLYFSASWCGPCKFVTPKLVTFRDRYKDFVEVVLVSQDRSEAEQFKYMEQNNMRWPAVRWADARAKEANEPKKLMGKYQGWGIPKLVVFSRSGEVLDDEAATNIRSLPEETVNRLEGYDYDKLLESYRGARAEGKK